MTPTARGPSKTGATITEVANMTKLRGNDGTGQAIMMIRRMNGRIETGVGIEGTRNATETGNRKVRGVAKENVPKKSRLADQSTDAKKISPL